MTDSRQASPSSRQRRRGSVWLVAGALFLLVGMLVAAAALWVAGGQRRADNVAGLARAPVGCDTTLDFERTGRFIVFIETTGTVEGLAGECDAEIEYDRDADDRVEPDLLLLDPSGDVVAFDTSDDSAAYDVEGFIGTVFTTVQIDTPGDHVLTVAPAPGEAFAIAVGQSPDDGVMLLRGLSVACVITAFLAGGMLLVLASRRDVATPTSTGPWTPDSGVWPAGPPGFPPPPPTTGATAPGGPPIMSLPVDRPVSAPPSSPMPWGPPGSSP